MPVTPPPPGTAKWQHAVVVGGGYAGLLAARVLSEHFAQVTILEQDLVTADTEDHSGVPQSRHPHAMLARGADIIEKLFPGIRDELAEMGAPVIDFGESAALMLPSGWAPRVKIGIPIQTFTRAALEKCIRRRVMARQRIVLRGGFRVEALCWDRTAGQVTGVSGRPRSSSPQADAETIFADLVVDASGRASNIAARLTDIGFPPPRALVVEGHLSYTSRLYHHTADDADGDWSGTMEYTYAPHVRRGGVLVTVEGKRRQVALIGAAGESAANDEAGFLDFARRLRNPLFAESITGATPAGPIYRMLNLKNQWTPYHRMRRWPDRLLCMGDVICALNPVYGQGMTVAGMQTLILRDLLKRRERNGNLTGLATRFQRHAARSLHLPWLMATSSDLSWSPHQAALTIRLAQWYFGKILELVPKDTDIFRRFFLTSHMVKSPVVLMHPRVILRVATTLLHRHR
jgi:2-polyprenyl-6-methoxyphenol hydroxylase-like FAD-dependent oxidoreductase